MAMCYCQFAGVGCETCHMRHVNTLQQGSFQTPIIFPDELLDKLAEKVYERMTGQS